MLTFFQIKRTFNRVSVTMYVDCEDKTVELVIKEGKLLRRTEENPVSFDKVQTPELAEQWLSHQVPVLDGTLGFMEYLDWLCGRGMFPFENKAA